MRIKDLIEKEDIVYVDKRINLNTKVTTTAAPKEPEPYILYICKKAMGISRKITQRDIPMPPPYALVIDEDRKCDADIPIIRVKNARRSLAIACSKQNGIDYTKFKVIGITGTNGKTTTATILYKILRYSGYNVGFFGTGKILYNDEVLSDSGYSMTTPDPVYLYSKIKEMQELGAQYVVAEISSHSIALNKIDAIPFHLCAFTNLSNEHMDFHFDLEDYYNTKLSLFSKCEYGVFNLDDKYSRRAYNEANCKKYGVGILQKAAGNVQEPELLGLEGSRFNYCEQGLSFAIDLKLIGAMNIYNALIAIRCALHLKIAPCDIRKAISEIEYIDGRMRLYQGKTRVIIDYAHTPNAYDNTLKTLKSILKPRQNLIVVFGCGGERDKEKRPLIAKAVSKYADKIIITEDNSRGEEVKKIIADIVSGIPEEQAYTVIPKRRDAILCALSDACVNDIVAIVGKGEEGYICDSNGNRRYSDEAVVLSVL